MGLCGFWTGRDDQTKVGFLREVRYPLAAATSYPPCPVSTAFQPGSRKPDAGWHCCILAGRFPEGLQRLGAPCQGPDAKDPACCNFCNAHEMQGAAVSGLAGAERLGPRGLRQLLDLVSRAARGMGSQGAVATREAQYLVADSNKKLCMPAPGEMLTGTLLH